MGSSIYKVSKPWYPPPSYEEDSLCHYKKNQTVPKQQEKHEILKKGRLEIRAGHHRWGAMLSPLTLHMFQMEEDGVLAHIVAQQLDHEWDPMRDDGLSLMGLHMGFGEALWRIK